MFTRAIWVFHNIAGERFWLRWWHVWHFVRRKTGLGKDARVYDLRHTFASVGAGGGLGLPIIGKLLGHTQSRTTQRYAHLADDPVREAAEKITTANTSVASGAVDCQHQRPGRYLTMREDEELAIEFLLGTPGPKGRAYLKPGSDLELKARAILARLMLAEAPGGYFTRLVAALIDPPRRSAIIKRKIVSSASPVNARRGW